MTREEIQKLTPEQLMAEVAKRVKPIRSDRLGTKTVPNAERTNSNGLVNITGTVYGYAEERLREDKCGFCGGTCGNARNQQGDDLRINQPMEKRRKERVPLQGGGDRC